jgi:hypothetical protein
MLQEMLFEDAKTSLDNKKRAQLEYIMAPKTLRHARQLSKYRNNRNKAARDAVCSQLLSETAENAL